MKKILLSIMILFLLGMNLSAQQGGYALKFDGSTQKVTVPNHSSIQFSGSANFTIEAWVYPTGGVGTAGWSVIVSKLVHESNREGYSVEMGADYKIVFCYGNNYSNWTQISSTSGIPTNQWSHVCAVFNGSSNATRLYINGTLAASGTWSAGLTDSGTGLQISGRPTYANTDFKGLVDEVRIWNIARTEAEIKAKMYKELAGSESNLAAYYKMDGTGTTLTDNSNNTNDGTLVNSPAWKASGCFAGSRQALDFDGSNDYVNISANSAYNTNTFTVEFWVKANSSQAGDYRGIVDKGRYTGSGQSSQDWYFITYAGNGVIILGLSGVGEVWFGTDGNWHHIAGTYDGTTLRGYLDGVLDNDLPTGIRSSPTTNGITVGRTQSNDYYFNGQLEELKIWNTARTANEIRENMFKTLSGSETGLVAYYRFDLMDGTSLFDLTSTANNGTLTNMDGATDWVASLAFNTWLGGESNAWATAANWSNGVPSAAHNAGIYNWSSSLPNVTTYLPVLPTTVSINNLLVPSGVSASGNVNLTATGSVFLGSNLTLSSSALNSAKDLVVESGKTLTIPASGQLTVSNTLTNSAGNSGLVIESGGSLIHNSNSVAATMKREISGSSLLDQKKYHFVSIPTQYASPTSNLFLGSYLYKLDPTQLYTTNHYGNWIALGTSTTTPLTLNQGYMVYYPAATTTYTFEGNLNNGDYTYSLTGHSGASVYTFNLVPNPYPSAIVWNTGDSGKWPTSTGVGGSCYIWNATSGNYSTISSGVSSYIPAGQAFMTLVTNQASPTLSVNNTARAHSSQAFYKSVAETGNQLVVKATSNNYADETVIAFREDATEAFDLQVDGMKLTGLEEAPQLYTLSGNEKYSINHLPVFEGQKIVPMNFETQFTGEVTLTFSNVESFETSLNIYLQDLISNQTINLRNQPVYIFSHNPQNAANRFNLVFGGTIGIGETTAQTAEMWISGKTLYINTPEKAGQPALLEVFDASGKVLTSRKVTLDELTTFELKQQGMIVVRLTTADDSLTTKGILMR